MNERAETALALLQRIINENPAKPSTIRALREVQADPDLKHAIFDDVVTEWLDELEAKRVN